MKIDRIIRKRHVDFRKHVNTQIISQIYSTLLMPSNEDFRIEAEWY